MHNKYDWQKKYKSILLEYFSSQAYAYVLAGTFLLTRHPDVQALFITGWIFYIISVLLLFAPIINFLGAIIERLDLWFKGGLFVVSTVIIILDGILNPPIGGYLFWALFAWLFLMITTNGFLVSRRIGLAKFLIFGLAGFGLLMLLSGYRETIYYTLTIIGLVLSLPMLDEILYSRLLK